MGTLARRFENAASAEASRHPRPISPHLANIYFLDLYVEIDINAAVPSTRRKSFDRPWERPLRDFDEPPRQLRDGRIAPDERDVGERDVFVELAVDHARHVEMLHRSRHQPNGQAAGDESDLAQDRRTLVADVGAEPGAEAGVDDAVV